MSLPDTALSNYAMMKINKTSVYSKALAHWNSKRATGCTIWENFPNHMIVEYDKLLAKGGEMMLAQ